MPMSEQEKNTLSNLFNKVGLEGSSQEEIRHYIKNIYLYKEPKEKIETEKNLNKINDNLQKQKYIMPEKLSFQPNLSNNKTITIINSIGEPIKDHKNNQTTNHLQHHQQNYQKQYTHKILKDKLSLNSTLPKENIHSIFSKIGEHNKQ